MNIQVSKKPTLYIECTIHNRFAKHLDPFRFCENTGQIQHSRDIRPALKTRKYSFKSLSKQGRPYMDQSTIFLNLSFLSKPASKL